MPAIYLIRHGQTDSDSGDDPGITELGKRQAAAAAAELVRRKVRDPLLGCGGLRRQRATADIIAKEAEIALAIADQSSFDEFDHKALLARYTGNPTPDTADNRRLQESLDEALAAWATNENGAWRTFVDDAIGALREMLEAAGSGRDVVIVTSGGIIAALCMRALGADHRAFVALNRMAINASITVLVAGSRGVNMLSFNDHAHLRDDTEALVTYR